MLTVLITGGGGFLGSHLADGFLARGDAVIALDTGSQKKVRHLLGHPRFRLVVDSVMNPDILDALAARADLIYHLAGIVGVEHYVGDPYEVLNININGTQNVLRAALKHGRRVVFTSTSEVYGKNPAVPWREDADRVLGPSTHRPLVLLDVEGGRGALLPCLSAARACRSRSSATSTSTVRASTSSTSAG